jgi:hypothetical protein
MCWERGCWLLTFYRCGRICGRSGRLPRLRCDGIDVFVSSRMEERNRFGDFVVAVVVVSLSVNSSVGLMRM